MALKMSIFFETPAISLIYQAKANPAVTETAGFFLLRELYLLIW